MTLERASTTRDGYGQKSEVWEEIGKRWAAVRFGTGAERRAAAQEGTSQAATFEMTWDRLTRSLTPQDRLRFDDVVWDIEGVVDTLARDGRVVTAVRQS